MTAATEHLLAAKTPWPWARIAALLLIWAACWFVSILFFRFWRGEYPEGNAMWTLPLTGFWFAWPVSFATTLFSLLQFLPSGVGGLIGVFAGFAFWPSYVTFLVFWLRTGRLRYLAILGTMSVLAAIGWHCIAEAALNV